MIGVLKFWEPNMGASTYNAHANQLTYAGFCALGGLTNPRLYTRDVYLGVHFMHTEYWMMPL